MATGLYGQSRYGAGAYGKAGDQPLSGVALGGSVAVASLQVTHLLGGVVIGDSIATGEINSPRALAGTATGNAVATASLQVTHLLWGNAIGDSAAAGFFVVVLPVVRPAATGEMPGTVNLVANPSVEIDTEGWTALNGAMVNPDLAHSWDGIASTAVSLPGTVADEGLAVSTVRGLGYTGAETVFAAQIRLAGTLSGLALWQRAVYSDGTTADGERLTGVTLARTGVGADWEYLTPPPLVADPLRILTAIEVRVAREVAAGAATFYADAAQIEKDWGQGPTAFARGSYGAPLGVWTGVPHRSISIRQPIGEALGLSGAGGVVTIAAELWRATYDNQHLEDLTPYLIGAEISMTPERDVTWTMAARITREGWGKLTVREDWLAPIQTTTMPDGTVRSRQLGLYYVWDGSQEQDEWGSEHATVNIDCRDMLWLLSRQNFPDTLRVDANTDKVRVARMVLDSAALTRDDEGRRRYALPDSNKRTKRDRDIPRDTNKLEIINRYLGGGVCYPLWSDNVGELRTAKRGRRRLKTSRPVRAWIAHLPENYDLTALGTRITSGINLPSEVVGSIREIPLEGDLENEVIITNDEIHGRVHVRHKITHPNNPRSIWYETRHGRTRRRSRNVPWQLVDDDADAREIAESIAEEISTRNRQIEIDVLPDPSIDYIRQTVALGIYNARGQPVAVGKWAVHAVSWSLTPVSGIQTMRLGRVDDAASILNEEAA